MTIGRFRKSSARARGTFKRREQKRRRRARQGLRIEALEDRRLLATGPQLVGIQPNQGDLLKDGDIRNVAPRELVFRFDQAAVIDDTTLDAIRITRSGGDLKFDVATARTDFNTSGQVIVEFQAKAPGEAGNGVSLLFSKRNVGRSAPPAIRVEGRTILVELNSTPQYPTTASGLINAINQNAAAKKLVQAVLVSGPSSTNIATPAVTYSPLSLTGGNQASVSSNFNTGGNLDITFTAVATGAAGNGIRIEVTKSNHGGAGSPIIKVVNGRTIRIDLNSNSGNETTAAQLVSVFNATPQSRALAVASNPVGNPNTKIGLASTVINYSPLILSGANDVVVEPGYVGLGDSPREVIFRFAENLPDDVYRIDIAGTGSAPLRSQNGFALGDDTDDGKDNGKDYALQFELDLGPQILGVVPQPIDRTTSGVLAQRTTQIEVYFNDDDLSPVYATNPNFYQLIYTNDTVQTTDDVVYKPIAVQYSPDTDRAVLTFGAPLHQLGSGAGTFRLRIGTDELFPLSPKTVIPAADPGSSFETAMDLSSSLRLGTTLEVIGSGASISDGQRFSVTDTGGKSKTFEFNDPSVGGGGLSAATHRAIVYESGDNGTPTTPAAVAAAIQSALADAVMLGELSVSATLNQTLARVYLSGEQSVTLGDGLRAVRTGIEPLLISSAIEPQVYQLDLPGASDEPGHRAISEQIESHLLRSADSENGIATIFYNFRSDYGSDPAGNKLSNLITADQKKRAREAFELWSQAIGVQFVETASQGIVVATGDMRALDPTVLTGRGDGVLGLSGLNPLTGQPTVILDNAENWYTSFGQSDDPLRPYSWFEVALREIGRSLGLGDTSDLPPGTIMGSDSVLAYGNDNVPEPVYPGDQDIVHGRHLYRNEGKDIDLYRFELTESGVMSAEILAERRGDSSLLDAVLALYREENGQRELIARNDDYFSDDSFLQMALQAGVYYIGVSAAGNIDYNPAIEDTGFGGLSEGPYDLRLTFRPDADNSLVDVDNALNTNAKPLSRATPLDGDGDGVPGGVFNFWFRVDATPIIVDKTAPSGGTGNLTSPFNTIAAALNLARNGDVVRIVGNGGTDGNLGTPEDAKPYEIGFGLLGQPLADGSTLNVPKGVTVMIDRGAVLKLRRARIGVGSFTATGDASGGALQVLGTPRLVDNAGFLVKDANGNAVSGQVTFTSYNDEKLGGDSNTAVPTTPAAGDWGGLMFRRDLDQTSGRLDREDAGIFLNYVNQADIRYGGGTVMVDGIPQTVTPIHAIDARPTVTFNSITRSADAALSANPDSFQESNFHDPAHQTVPFTSDYTRVGPVVYGNRLVGNSLNGLFVRLQTPAGSQLEQMTVSGRWDDTDVVHVLAENLRIQGSPGGPIQAQTLTAPAVNLVTLTRQNNGGVPAGKQTYKLTFVDAQGREGPASDPTASVLVVETDAATGATQNVLLSNLPTAPAGHTRRLYRSVKSEYVLVAELNAGDRSYLDKGTVLGQRLTGSAVSLQARLHGSLTIDPGTIVKLNGAGIETGFGAQLLAEGLDGSEVVFTALQDDRYGAGGTFVTSDRDDLAPGGWTGLYLGPASQASLDHAVLAYGGGVSKVPGNFAAFNVLEIHQADVRVANSVFEQNAGGTGGQSPANRGGRGENAEALIFVRGAQPVLLGNVMQDNAGPVISIDVNSLNHELITDPGRGTGAIGRRSEIVANAGPLVRENRLGGNGINGMAVRGGTLTTQGIWDDTDIVHVVRDETIYVPDFHTYGGLRLESGATASLVIKLLGNDAGFTATGRPLDITDRIGGVLQVLGQPGFPVVFTSLNDDSVGAGFQPDGRPQTDTNNDGDPRDADPVVFPTVPNVPNGVRIDNNVATNVIGHFEFEPEAGGGGRTVIGPTGTLVPDGVTVQGNTQLLLNNSFISEYLNYIDVGSDGQAIDLSTTTIVTPPTLVSPDEVISEGTFLNANGNVVNWRARSYFASGSAALYNELTFTGIAPLGNIRLISYLNANVLTIDDDLLSVSGQPGEPGFQVLTLDDGERIGLSQGGYYVPGEQLVNATFDGWAADQAPLLGSAITGAGATYSVAGNVNTANLVPFVDPALGPVYGLGDVSTAFAWTLDPLATTATVVTFLNLVPQDPSLAGRFAGDWRSLQIREGAHDRNVNSAVEHETGNATVTGTNDTPATAQYLGELAPDEKSGDDTRRLGLEVRGALNRPSDLDVYMFRAVAGTEVWLDIDRTSPALDTVLELIDGDGLILGRSDNSGEEAENPNLLYRNPALSDPLVINPLAKSDFESQDRWTTNPHDAGMRVVLPGPVGATNTYYVRVRSSSNQLGSLNAGLTTGVYQLQVRLRELDEIPGSTIQMADIRYATTGIEVTGGVSHSPLTGEAAEVVDEQGADTNDDMPAASALGNLLTTDRGTLSVAGELASRTDVDWYQLEIQYGPKPESKVDLTQGVWDVTGTDTGNINWNGSTLVFQRQTPAGDDFTVTGYFYWTGTGGRSGRENFTGTLLADNSLQLTGTQIVQPASQIALRNYSARVSRDGRSITNGTWAPVTGGQGQPGTWSASRTVTTALGVTPQHAAVVFDIDYADGFARANTNLWVFDAAGQLVLVGGDSDTLDDRPVKATELTQDLSRGSVGVLDPFIGPVQLPAASGLVPGTYYVAVTSNAVIPEEMQQFLQAAPANPLVRLEPINSVIRVAEDRVDAIGSYSTAKSPQVPVLFGADNMVTLFVPGGSRLKDGESFTLTNAAGNSATYEFDADGRVTPGRVAIPFAFADTANDIGRTAVEVINENLPAGLNSNDPLPVPMKDRPLITSTVSASGGEAGQVTISESVEVQTLLNEVAMTDPITNQLQKTPIVRSTSRQQDPQVRQAPAPGEAELAVYVSRPAVMDYTLGDVTMFVTQASSLLNRTELVSVDAHTGQLETRIGAFGANVGDVAMHPRGALPAVGNGGGLFTFSIPETIPHDDSTTGNYWQINPSLNTPGALGEFVDDDEIETYEEDIRNPGDEIEAGPNQNGVGIDFNAITFSGQDQDLGLNVRGFAIGNRGDTTYDLVSGQFTSDAYRIPNPANILFEFNPNTGQAINPPGYRDKTTAQQLLGAGGTQIWQRGTLDTERDEIPSGGSNTTVGGVDATIQVTDPLGNISWLANVEDGDYFGVDRNGDGQVDTSFEFDTGPEFLISVNANNAANPQLPQDGDAFTVDGYSFEFDTGSVILVTALNGGNLTDGTTLTITNNAPTPQSTTFEFDSDNNNAGNPIPFSRTDNQTRIANSIITAITNAGFGVQAMLLPGTTNRITLIGESTTDGATTNETGITILGRPGVSGNAIPVFIEETYAAGVVVTADEVGQAIAAAVSDARLVDPSIAFQAGAAGNRLNFMGALAADFSTVRNPAIFAPRGVPGTINQFRLPVPFLVSDTTRDIADRVYQAVTDASLNASQTGSTVLLEPAPAGQPVFVCNSFGTPPQIGAPGIPDCPLQSGGAAPGGSITGMAFIGPQLYAVTNTGGLFRITERGGSRFNPNSPYNVADYIDGSQTSLQAVNDVTLVNISYTTALQFVNSGPATLFDAGGGFVDAGFLAGGRLLVSETNSNDGVYTIAQVTPDTITLTAGDALTSETVASGARLRMVANVPVQFAGLVAGPKNAAGGRYENLLFGISDTGRLFAFDTWGRPQAVFANASYYVDTGVDGANGIAFSTLDDNLWHVTTRRATLNGSDPGHASHAAYDGSRVAEQATGNKSLYFGYEAVQGQPVSQTQFGTQNFAPNVTANTYDFPGGAQGSLISNPFSLAGTSAADKPALYFDYFLRTENADTRTDMSSNTTLGNDPMRDAFRVYISGDDGRWKLLATNNSEAAAGESDDESDPFPRLDSTTGELAPEQPFARATIFDNDGSNESWRQARVDLSPYAGQKNLRLRFDFSTAGGMSSGGNLSLLGLLSPEGLLLSPDENLTLDLNTAGNELRALAGYELRDGQMFTLTGEVQNPVSDLFQRVDVMGFEFDFGPTIAAPTGAAIGDGARFVINQVEGHEIYKDSDGTVYEFDNDGTVGATNSIPHIPVPFTGLESAGELAAAIGQVLAENPPVPITLSADLIADEAGANDTLATAYDSRLNGTTQTLRGTGYIGDNVILGANVSLDLDVDMVRVYLDAGDQLVAYTDTQRLATQLDAYLRLFDANGVELAFNDTLDPNNPFIRDAEITYTATARGFYYIGISAAHNPNYNPWAMGSGAAVPDKVVSQGYYEFVVSVIDPSGVLRVGNRLNLPNADSIVATGLPAGFVEGSAGVTAGLPNPMAAYDPTLPNIPVVPVRVNLAMTSLDVADAIRVALADHLGSGHVDAINSRNEAVQIVGYGVGDPGPLGLSGPSDPTTAEDFSGLFGDRFGAFNASAGFNGQTSAASPGALRMRDNAYEGVYIDNILIGFASRGEMVTGSRSAANPQFVDNTAQSGDEIETGPYQLEIRQATEYGRTIKKTTTGNQPSLELYDTFDINDRLADGVTLTVAAGHVYRDGQSFTVSDGTNRVTFEFDDQAVADGVQAGRDAIGFAPSDSSVVMARRIRDAINAAADAGRLSVWAVSRDGVYAGPQSTSDRVHLPAGVQLAIEEATGGVTPGLPAAESNDTLDVAVETGIAAGGQQGYRAAGWIGDNPDVRPFGAEIDLFRVELAAGEMITIDIDATELGSPLDAHLRVFDAHGAPVLIANALGVPQMIESDDNVTPGESAIVYPAGIANRDPFLAFVAPAGGVYYIGVSGFNNNEYDPRTLGVGSSDPADITPYNGEVYFTAFSAASGRELWKLNAAGLPVLAADIYPEGSSDPAELTVFNNELYFTAYHPDYGRELWKINAAGAASLVTDVFADGSSAPSGLTVFNNALYFAAYTTSTGRELWKTTPGGVASLVADIDPFGSSDPADLTPYNNELYFSAFAPTTGRELWKVDAAGIARNVVDLASDGSSDPADMTVFNGELYFSAATAASGRELWKLNPWGLVSQVTELEPSGSSDPAGFTVFNNQLYFAATTAGDRELWKVDAIGNAALVSDLNPAGSSDPSALTVFNNQLHFAAQGPAGGRELWKLNAVGSVTQVADLEPAGSSDPLELSVSGGTAPALYFSAFTAVAGRELWRLTAAGEVSQVADLEQARRRDGSTGYYEIEIRRPLNSGGLELERYQRKGDANLFRDQGQLVIRDNTISDSSGWGIVVQAGARDDSGASHPGPVRNLAVINTARLAPGVVVANNVLAFNQAGGIRFGGDTGDVTAGPLQPASVPFGRVVNNTIYGATRGGPARAEVDLVFVIDTSGSMADDVQSIRQRIGDLDATLRGANIDPHYGLVTFPGDGPTPVQIQDIVDFATFTAEESPFLTFTVPAGGNKEYGSLALREALNDVGPETEFTFRPGAQILTVLVTDEEDDSTAADFTAALNAFQAHSAVFFGLALNPSLPFDFDSATNNTDARYGELARRTGGQLFDIASFALNPQPFFDGLTEAISGVLASAGTTGILVENNASPTLLNNVVAALETGIRIDTSSASTVVGGTVYQGNGTPAMGIVAEDFPLYPADDIKLFRDPSFANFYPAAGSPIVDSAIDALEDRWEMVQVSAPLGIAPSPIQTPKYDAWGQLRVDDPQVAPPPGLGANVFKDRGAIDRSDFEGPGAKLVRPLDNGADDQDPTATFVNLIRGSLDGFSIQLDDGRTPLFGSGIDDTTVLVNSVRVVQDVRELEPGKDYTVWYDFTNNVLHIVPMAGVWDLDSNYVIQLQNQDRYIIGARRGDKVADGDSFRIEDAYGNSFTFEYDTGYVVTVPETIAIQVPLQGGGLGGVADGDTVVVVATLGGVATTATIEFDNNNVLASEDNVVVQFTSLSTQGEVADALVTALKNVHLGLNPANIGGGLVHLGVDGTQTVTVTSAALAQQGVEQGVLDGETFTIDDGRKVVTFELSTDGRAATGRVPVRFAMTQTHKQIAAAIAAAVNTQPLGLSARDLGDGRVQLGGGVNHQVDVSLSHLTLSGEPGVRLPFGIRIPTAGGSFRDLIQDGETFVLSDSRDRTATFELDDNNDTIPGNIVIPFTTTTTTQQLADTLVVRIRDAGLGLCPYNAGSGIVVLGGEGISLDVSQTNLSQVGASGLPGALSISVTPAETFTEAQVAAVTADAINGLGLPGVRALPDPETYGVAVSGAETLSGAAVEFFGSIKDLAGNSIRGNQANGETRFTVFIGVGMDYGDAPKPYPTLREDDGARHVVLSGFSLGATVDVNADGQPSAGADGDDNDGNDDEDGVVFDPTTPLVPNRKSTITVSTSGIVNDVVPFGVLDAWIDYNRDGDWLDAGERILTNVVLNKSVLDDRGVITFRDLLVPSWAVPGETYARFRLSTTGGLSPTGEASAGEVEDYRVIIYANPWQNPTNRHDVNNSLNVSPIDALLLINYLNSFPVNPLPLPKPANLPFYDVSGDGNATAEDVLLVINEINRLNLSGGEGEANGQPQLLAPSPPSNHLEDVLRGEEDWLDIVADVDRSLASGSAVDAIFADFAG